MILKANDWLDILRDSIKDENPKGIEMREYRKKQQEIMELVAQEREGKNVRLPSWFSSLVVEDARRKAAERRDNDIDYVVRRFGHSD
jgi:hypothetical protein